MLKGASLGIALMLAVQVVMPMNDAVAKYLVATLPAIQVAWARFFFNSVFIVPYAFACRGRPGLTVRNPGLQVLRGLLIIAGNLTFILGIRYVPLADALATVFIAPLAVTAASAPILGERITPAHWIAVTIGFAGALVIVRPGAGSFQLAGLLPLCSGLLFAAYLVLTRWLVRGSSPVATQAVTALVGAITLSMAAPFVWQPVTAWNFLLMVTVGLLSSIGHVMMTVAHVHAEASTLAPLTYLALISATILGFVIFGDLPDIWTIIGAAIVIGSGLFVTLSRRHRQDRP
ncbi:MAG: DMT family transporter [Geminicoccaceae bacterium]|nr:DMT family transporter [Geminicoccaceae bacterium]